MIDKARALWDSQPQIIVLFGAMILFFLLAPYKPAGDMYFVELTMDTLIKTDFHDFYITHDKGPMQIEVDGKVYMAYPVNIGLCYAALHQAISSSAFIYCLAGLLLFLVYKRRFIPIGVLGLYAAALYAHFQVTGNAFHSLVSITQALLAAFCLYFFCRLVRRLGQGKHVLLLVALVGLGSFFPVSSKAYNREVYYLLPCLAAICFLLDKKHWLAGLCLAAGIFLRFEMATPMLFCFAVNGLYRWRKDRLNLSQCLKIAAPYALFTVVSLLAIAYFNWTVIGKDLGYVNSMRSSFGINAFVGLLISPGKGFFIYFPAAIYIAHLVLTSGDKRLDATFLFLTIMAVYLLQASCAGPWYGGVCWGPRYLTISVFAGVCLLAIFAGKINRKALIGFVIAGFLINFPAALLDAAAGLPYYYEINKEKIEAIKDDPSQLYYVKEFAELSDAIFIPRYSPILLNYETFGKWLARKRGTPYLDVLARFLATGGK